MIIISGQLTNLYISYLIIGFGKSKYTQSNIHMRFKQPIKGQSRISILIILVSQQWIFNIYNNWQGSDLILMDGLCKCNNITQITEIYQQSQMIIILYIIGTNYTTQISKRSEQFQMIITNLIAQIQQQNSNDLIITIITWEQMNQSQYQQITMQGNTDTGISQSAGIKYFQQSAQTTAFLQMGVSQIYGKTGNLNYDIQIAIQYLFNISSINDGCNIITEYIGQLLILITLMFKQGAAPFHYWAPDLYDSLPTPILIYVIIIPKVTILVFQYIIMPIIGIKDTITFTFINCIAIMCIIIGSIGLNSQWRIKRFITYSTISHLGFIQLAYISYSWDSYFNYIYIYGITNLLFFYIILIIGSNLKGNEDDLLFIKEQSGIYKMNPFLSIAFAIILFSQAGIPPQAGFLIKLEVIKGLIDGAQSHQAIILIVGSIISTYNYLSFIKITNLNTPKYIYSLNIYNYNSYIISFLFNFTIFIIFKFNIIIF